MPSFSGSTISRTRGKSRRTISAVPSVEALSTTITSSPPSGGSRCSCSFVSVTASHSRRLYARTAAVTDGDAPPRPFIVTAASLDAGRSLPAREGAEELRGDSSQRGEHGEVDRGGHRHGHQVARREGQPGAHGGQR